MKTTTDNNTASDSGAVFSATLSKDKRFEGVTFPKPYNRQAVGFGGKVYDLNTISRAQILRLARLRTFPLFNLEESPAPKAPGTTKEKKQSPPAED